MGLNEIHDHTHAIDPTQAKKTLRHQPLGRMKMLAENLASSPELAHENGENDFQTLSSVMDFVLSRWMRKVNGVWVCDGGNDVCVLHDFIENLDVDADMSLKARVALEAGLKGAKTAFDLALRGAVKVAAELDGLGSDVTYGFRLGPEGKVSVILTR